MKGENTALKRGGTAKSVLGGGCHREISTRSKEFVVDSKEGKGDVGNSSQDEETAGLPL